MDESKTVEAAYFVIRGEEQELDRKLKAIHKMGNKAKLAIRNSEIDWKGEGVGMIKVWVHDPEGKRSAEAIVKEISRLDVTHNIAMVDLPV